MKEIKATIQPHMTEKVIEALHELQTFPGVTVFKCQGQGRGKGHGGSFVVTEAEVGFAPKERLEIVCEDALAEAIVRLIAEKAHTGNPGDGIITVTTVNHHLRIRTGEGRQPGAEE
jgi:nitrogen regulatory protein P-II 1